MLGLCLLDLWPPVVNPCLGGCATPLAPPPSQTAVPKSDAAPYHDEETLKRNKKVAETTRKLVRFDD